MRIQKRNSREQDVFIHRSIKTRIETMKSCLQLYSRSPFLYIDPLKQGLKRIIDRKIKYFRDTVFIHRSIKTRIETENITAIEYLTA